MRALSIIISSLIPSRLARLLGLFWLCCLALHVQAGCPAFPTTVPADGSARITALHQLDASTEACTQDADWHAQRGALLLASGRSAEAAESLERAILLAPGHAGARIDYADALAQLGDTATALELASALLALPDLPTRARLHLQARLQEWQTRPPAPASPWQQRHQLNLQMGWESNLNGAPAADTLLLTLADGPVRLPLMAPRREGAASLADGQLQLIRPLAPDWHLLLHGRLRLRDTAGSDSDYLFGQFAASLLRRLPGGDLALQANQLEQHFGGEHLLAETRASAQYLWLASGCRPRAGLDVAHRRYPAASALDGLQWGLRGGLQCTRGPWQLDGDLRLATDEPQHAARPGGPQHWTELQLTAQWQGPLHTLRAEASLGQVRDTAGYSPLLDYNATRRIRRSALRLEASRPLDDRWELTGNLEYFRQQANIGLFELNNLGLYFGARYRY